MATTPVSKPIGTTGASGNSGFATLVTAHTAAIATAVTTAQAVTGATGITISPAQLTVDSVSATFEMLTTILYTVVS